MATGGGDGEGRNSYKPYFTRLEMEYQDKIEGMKKELAKKDAQLKEAKDKLALYEEHCHQITARLAAISQSKKEERPRLEQMIGDLTSMNNQLMDTVERLEKQVEKKEKKKLSHWIPFLKKN